MFFSERSANFWRPGRFSFSQNLEGAAQLKISRMTYLRRYSTFSVPTSWNGNYRSICTKFPFLLLELTLASCAIKWGFWSTNEIASFSLTWKKAFLFNTETVRNRNFWINRKCSWHPFIGVYFFVSATNELLTFFKKIHMISSTWYQTNQKLWIVLEFFLIFDWNKNK